jgi:hypothetical protein
MFFGRIRNPWSILCRLIMICVVTGLPSGKGWKIAPITLKLKGGSGLSFVGVEWRLLPSTLPFDDQLYGYWFVFSPE